MSFVQVVEYETDQPDEMRALGEQWSQEHPTASPTRLIMSEDMENPGHFIIVAEFDSYQQAMEHSGQPETMSYAERMRELASQEPRFINLAVAYQE